MKANKSQLADLSFQCTQSQCDHVGLSLSLIDRSIDLSIYRSIDLSIYHLTDEIRKEIDSKLSGMVVLHLQKVFFAF